ncbi:hypothetical protein FN846DRAFT_1025832 [Sphaerosporella brunnea]|uniref:Uncharacterized protein n=1 Tax=Sphaerosporella brunnea TaxID=1250544 RepID=A0A5J5EE86_9PEZI|nr:hypothetical protein FN846DRAFT_1025832 [Sphaerosporella brunnea]
MWAFPSADRSPGSIAIERYPSPSTSACLCSRTVSQIAAARPPFVSVIPSCLGYAGGESWLGGDRKTGGEGVKREENNVLGDVLVVLVVVVVGYALYMKVSTKEIIDSIGPCTQRFAASNDEHNTQRP